jgi:23S rRNA pseudouridine1911/1915/1917 synthase
MPVQPLEETVVVPGDAAGERLDRFLARVLGLGIERVRALVKGGRVHIRGKVPSEHRKLFGGEQVLVARLAPRAAAPARKEPALGVLHDDRDCLVVDKPAGLPVEPAVPGAPSVVGAASHLGAFDVGGHALPGLAHRLDRDTTGCLLLARHDRALAALLAAFQAGRVEKTYLAVVAGAPPDSGALDTPYGRSAADPRRFTTRLASARRARLAFLVRERLGGAALLEVRLETGRTHQIRVQLAEAGYPVLGDATYGVPSEGIARQALHASRLAFPSPSGAAIVVEAPLPPDLADTLMRLRVAG